jgi:hypothetical protein
MPHALGQLRLWTLRAGKLVEIAQARDTSNHVAGSTHLGMSAVADFNGDGVADLAVPSFDRRWLRVFTFKGGVRELSRHALPTQAANDFAVAVERGRPSVVVGLAGGQRIRVTPGPR